MTSHRTTSHIYDHIYDTLLSMPSHLVLARAEYGVDFARHVGANTTWDYRANGTDVTYKTILVGEIRPALCGTRFSAKGTHYMGSAANPVLIYDKTRVKSMFVLGKPADCTEELSALFENQIATLRDVVVQDVEELKAAKKNIIIKEWTSHAGAEATGDPDYINVVTDVMYTVPKPGTTHVVQTMSRKKHALTQRTDLASSKPTESPKATVPPVETGPSKKNEASKGRRKGLKAVETTNQEDINMDEVLKGTTPAATEEKGESATPKANTISKRSTIDVYGPGVLYDYGGDLFRHENAMLKQLDFRDVDDELLPPDVWYSALKQGTLVMVRATLNAFNFESQRVYQLNAHTIKVLDKSSLTVELRKPTVLQTASQPKTSNSEAAQALATVQLGKRAHGELA